MEASTDIIMLDRNVKYITRYKNAISYKLHLLKSN